METSRLSCLSDSFLTSLGMPALSRASLSSSSSSDSSPPSPSSRRMAFICSRRKKSFCALSMPSLAMFWILACMAATSASLTSCSLTRRRRSMGSSHSSRRWASSTRMRRLEATRSASRPGSLTLLSTAMMSAEAMPRSDRIFSLCSLAARIMASCSRVTSLVSRSGRTSMAAARKGSVDVKSFTRARVRPWTRTLSLPSGILSMRMIMPTVPTR